MLIQTLKTLFQRDLNKLKSEIEQYQEEAKIWLTEKDISNSAGNLCLHLVGNLKTFIGLEIGKFHYVRQRELEFSSTGIPKAELIRMVEETATIVDRSLDQLSEAALQAEYPILVFAEKTTTEYFLVHLATHLGYHLGQINYHRRLLG
jgi:uncharacterized damage-inducible protein DinB